MRGAVARRRLVFERVPVDGLDPIVRRAILSRRPRRDRRAVCDRQDGLQVRTRDFARAKAVGPTGVGARYPRQIPGRFMRRGGEAVGREGRVRAPGAHRRLVRDTRAMRPPPHRAAAPRCFVHRAEGAGAGRGVEGNRRTLRAALRRGEDVGAPRVARQRRAPRAVGRAPRPTAPRRVHPASNAPFRRRRRG